MMNYRVLVSKFHYVKYAQVTLTTLGDEVFRMDPSMRFCGDNDAASVKTQGGTHCMLLTIW